MDSRACTAQGGSLDSIPSVTIMPGVRVDCYRLLPIQIRGSGNERERSRFAAVITPS